ncbi:hypothetical protein RJ639_025053, partial [Escallonia herrerae]
MASRLLSTACLLPSTTLGSQPKSFLCQPTYQFISNTPSGVLYSSSLSPSSRASNTKKSVKCQAAGDSSFNSPVYQGVYGPWSVDSSDIREVILYRSGLVTAAVSFLVALSTAYLPDDYLLSTVIKQHLDLFYALGAGGLGLSLLLIHIYVTEIKLTLQALW